MPEIISKHQLVEFHKCWHFVFSIKLTSRFCLVSLMRPSLPMVLEIYGLAFRSSRFIK